MRAVLAIAGIVLLLRLVLLFAPPDPSVFDASSASAAAGTWLQLEDDGSIFPDVAAPDVFILPSPDDAEAPDADPIPLPGQ